MPRPLFIPAAAWQRLKENGKQAAFGGDGDVAPVVKLFTPDAQATWLLTEVDPVDTDRAFGLCDLGLGFPELGYVDLRELAALRGSLGLPVELDQGFEPAGPLSAYLGEARAAGKIVPLLGLSARTRDSADDP